MSPPSNAQEDDNDRTSPDSIKYKRPYAPLEALLPALRVKRLIDQSVELASTLENKNNNNSNNDTTATIQVLQALLLTPQNLTASTSSLSSSSFIIPAQQYLESYQKSRSQLPLLIQPGALLVQSGEIMTWQRLKQRERNSEKENEIRAALNLYTNALVFDADKYTWTAPRDVKKKLIRNDQIPDVKSVIASDLGLRSLYRNEILNAMDNARAEMEYQLTKQAPQQQPLSETEEAHAFDASDLLVHLQDAQRACDKWFAFIEEQDIRNAMEVLKNETGFINA